MSEPLADELDSLIAQTEAVAESLDEVEVSEGRLGLNLQNLCFGYSPAILS